LKLQPAALLRPSCRVDCMCQQCCSACAVGYKQQQQQQQGRTAAVKYCRGLLARLALIDACSRCLHAIFNYKHRIPSLNGTERTYKPDCSPTSLGHAKSRDLPSVIPKPVPLSISLLFYSRRNDLIE
jgi:hypothetical protein